MLGGAPVAAPLHDRGDSCCLGIDSLWMAMLRCEPRVSGQLLQRSRDEDPIDVQMQAKQLWQAVLSDLERRLSRTAFDNWLRPSTIIDFADDVATIGAA